MISMVLRPIFFWILFVTNDGSQVFDQRRHIPHGGNQHPLVFLKIGIIKHQVEQKSAFPMQWSTGKSHQFSTKTAA